MKSSDFFITNAANTRVFNFTIPGVKMKLVGADGGKYDYETWVDSVVLGPSERAVVEVLFNYGKYSLVNKTPNRSYVLGTVEVFDNKATLYDLTFETLRDNPDTKSDHDNFIQSKRRTLNKELRLFMRTDMGMGMGGMSMMSTNPNPILWDDIGSMMNMMGNSGMVKWNIQDAQTGNINENIKWNFKVGDRVKIKIQNNTRQGFQMQHPIHFHGQRFLVTAINGVKNNNMVWKDTVLIPYGSTYEIMLEISNPGIWMAHCHIAEHMESGMNFHFTVTK